MIAYKQARFVVLVSLLLGAARLPARAQDAPPPPPVAPSAEPPPGYGPPPALTPSAERPNPPPQGSLPPPAYQPSPPPAFPPPSYAPAPQGPVHHGLFLHLHLGLAFTSLTATGGSSGTEKYSGSGLGFHIALGAGLTENLALFGTLFGSSLGTYDLTVGGTDKGKVNGIASADGLGLGVIYYFEPIDLYLSGTLALVEVNVDDPTNYIISRQSNYGVAFEGMIGKEWWVSRHWGLGAALEILGATKMQDKDVAAISWSADTFSVLLSVTYF